MMKEISRKKIKLIKPRKKMKRKLQKRLKEKEKGG